ncbi:MAG TPA: CHAT domain-containing protein, partial [Thermoanaerobaculia bacterium]|nr:CHAT domain-containing protein [Thermoanaerobaculia bacterium]
IKKTSSAPLFKRALEIAPPTDPDELSNLHSRLGIALIGERRFDEAQQHVEPALQLARTPQRKLMAYSFAQSLSHSQGRIAEAIAYGKEGIRVAPNSLRNLWLIQSELGQMLLECGETEEGIAMLRESIDRIEARRTTLPTLMPAPSEAGRAFGNRIFVYHVLEAALLGQGRLEDALSIAERTRGRALFDILHGHRWNRAIPAAEREREHALNQRIVDLNRELARSEGEAALKVREQLLEARAAFDELSLEIDLRYPRGDATTPQPLDLAEIRIDAGTAIVEYSLSADRKTINAYVVRSSGALFGLHLPAPQESVLSEVRLLRKQIESRDGGYRGQAQKLYELLIAPIAAHLEGARHLIIVPDGALWNVPFQALVTPSGEHLAERHAISYAPSLTTLQQRPVRRVARAQKDLLAFGDPLVSEQTTKSATERGLELASLPDAADEVKNLQRLYGAGRSTVYTGAAASEASFKELAPRYRVLHLAAHGIVDDSSPLYSAVVLAAKPDGEEDGFLEMREMRELDLQADLVVLSACDTGRGDLAPGEGMIGMSWALMAAGCPATVVSQWKADSQTTALLMVEFHKELLAGHSPAEALQRAQKKLWRSTKQWSWHPYYWAPFVVVTSTLP